jgi:tRNA(Ile)-lysidine synthase
MDNFTRNLLTEWRRLELPVKDATMVVAVSGGADSVSLLLALHELRERKKLDLQFIAAHFNHGLRGEQSDADAEYVKQLSDQYRIELALGRSEVSRIGNLEQNARKARYEFLGYTAVKLNAPAVLTAHSMNDQAETFLMNLIRGSGIEGLAAMMAVRSFSEELTTDNRLELPVFPSVMLVRPLLRWAKRADTENYCREKNVEFRRDAMNEDLAFRRVWIRKALIPMIAEVNPKIVETLSRTAELLQHVPEPLGSPDTQIPEELAVKDLKTLAKPELYARLRRWLRTRRGNVRSLELKHIEAVERLVNSRRSGKTVELPGGGRVTKHGGRLQYRNIKVEK